MSAIASIKSIIYAKGYNRQEWTNLINICNCKGTMKCVHYECIFIWIQKRKILCLLIIN